MTITLKIPTPLRRFTANQANLALSAQTVRAALDELVGRYPDLRVHLFDESGDLRRFVNVYLRGEDVRQLQGLDTPLADGDEVMIIPSIAGGDALPHTPFTRDEYLRYSRHFNLPEIGISGQEMLKHARVLIVGAGGLGSPAALYLAAAGVGLIGLVDFDRVDLSNLQRQILYETGDIGRPKLQVAKRRIQGLNPHVEVRTYAEGFQASNALEIAADYDIVVDGTDNFPTRYLVNDTCVFLKKLNVYGSIYRFDGQVSVFGAPGGPCYRCLYPDPPPRGLVPSCAEGGVLGVLPGIVGSMQAAEALKYITGAGESLVGRLLLFDALTMSFREVRLRRDPDCPVCGDRPTITAPIDYESFCGVSSLEEPVTVPETSARQAGESLSDPRRRAILLDVREPWEVAIARITPSVQIPLNALPQRLGELEPAREIYTLCRTGHRSASAAEFLIRQGFPRVKNVHGGIYAWAEEVDPSLTRY